MHGQLRSSREFESKIVAHYKAFELRQLQQTLRQTVPHELEQIADMPDSERSEASRKLARLLMTGYFSKWSGAPQGSQRFKDWNYLEQDYEAQVIDQKKRDRLVQLFSEIDSSAKNP